MKKNIDNTLKEDYPEYHIDRREIQNDHRPFSDSDDSFEIEQ